jgi:tRNA(Ile)-lysidine synthetase-like protein
MRVNLQPGKYIVAISGGVDSMVLLNLLLSQFDNKSLYQFIIAHYDHGIRQDSKKDRLLVENVAKASNLVFFYQEGHLGPMVSEELARKYRYDFLFSLQQKLKIDQIITAHHQDDLIETVIFNILRGTGRLGLSPLMNNSNIIHPLIKFKKIDIIKYANDHNLIWREDSTNFDLKYSRNFIRHKIIPVFNQSQLDWLVAKIQQTEVLNQQIDQLFLSLLNQNDKTKIKKSFINHYPDLMAKDFLAFWLRQNNLRNFDKKAILRLYKYSQLLETGKKIDIKDNYYIQVEKEYLALKQYKC